MVFIARAGFVVFIRESCGLHEFLLAETKSRECHIIFNGGEQRKRHAEHLLTDLRQLSELW